MYQPRLDRPLPRPPRQTTRQAPYLVRNLRAPQKSGYQRAAAGDVRAHRQGATMSAAQDKDGPNNSSVNPQLLSAPSITNSQRVSEVLEDDSEIRTYISNGFGAIQQAIFDLTEKFQGRRFDC
nr:uncharacterized protein CTRU02_13550 [Colletotrichum truncatum]XP_036584606.1 uncharacterized protein CTRU02_05681 [Colletotrichum truncatum]KAF6783314.1 hypothetical protein CTRU02_13550 [Colletotrichum truncatum]KAF6794124.1 hypothetical protein CTRU02_05681 [Colletotrichum truncatum]